MPSFNKILIANRGEIACRVMRTAQALGYRTVAVYSEADTDARHVQLADEAVCIGPAPVGQSYLSVAAILEAARKTGADAVHPGYGFLSENAEFARACEAAGIVFIGPTVDAIHLMGSKRLSKLAMLEAGVPCIPGYEGAEQDDATLAREAGRIGYPLMIKASAGGGGRGMRLVNGADELTTQLRTARSEALNAFGSAELILEKAVIQPRHVEIQVFGDRQGNLVYLGERDCSVQRRHQKVIEEAPCPVMTPELRQAMGDAAVKAARTVNYVGAGTVEFLLDASGAFYFLEMNTRLQVEHPVTELITGQDLVAWQIRVAEGQTLPLKQDEIRLDGHAMEVRLYAEDPAAGFLPQTGDVLRWEPAELEGIRIDHGLVEGQAVTPFYDPMLAKVIAWGATREEARRKLARAVEDCVLLGVRGNQRFLPTCCVTRSSPPGKPPPPSSAKLSAPTRAWHRSRHPRRAGDGRHPALPGLCRRQRPPGRSRWLAQRRQRPWRLTLRQGEQKHSVELAVQDAGQQPRLLTRVNDAEIAIRLLSADGRWAVLELDGVRRRVAYHQRATQLWLFGQNGNLELQDVTHEPAGGQAGAASGTVKAPMDGAIVEVLVSEGDRVGKGQLLVVLEAMKMEHPLKAGVDGVIRRVQVSRGDQVKSRQLLVEVEEAL